jgi:hypothetical protein
MRTTTSMLAALLLSCSNNPSSVEQGGGDVLEVVLPGDLVLRDGDGVLPPGDGADGPDEVALDSYDLRTVDQPESPFDVSLELTDLDVAGGLDQLDLMDIETLVLPPGATGEMCVNDEDCIAGTCVGTTYGYLCLPACIDDLCPYGWQCVQSEPSLCVPFFENGCLECGEESCPAAWCRELGDEGPRCLQPCLVDGDCPLEFHCILDDFSQVFLCQPDNGSCFCGEADMDGWKDCERTNEFGTCTGNAMCLPGRGRQECMAKVPAEDLCDGVDNDCDGFVDENFPLVGKPCDGPDPDDCHAGKYQCAADGTTLSCEGDTSYAELCNDIDDDCDGEVDEDFTNLGKPCGVSPLCGTGKFICSPLGLKTVCGGVKPTKEVCDGLDNDCDGKVDEGFKDSDGDGVADCVD